MVSALKTIKLDPFTPICEQLAESGDFPGGSDGKTWTISFAKRTCDIFYDVYAPKFIDTKKSVILKFLNILIKFFSVSLYIYFCKVFITCFKKI